ncbi:hypothetical protein DPMN_182705 [Dreissena polymorpha]|uniref:Uncharacterized protein n=1 Tax=Dreissena polymorpha TaxID=45954 RepID=A0A9D4I6C0_DREPO|nr:hypothetical protein DPMN_182635 [Dreissena polymorpha]KAH3748267.1 hypothetical protein DPMN_182705 [Dreissena polymorpha]
MAKGKLCRGWTSNLWPKTSSIEPGIATYDQGKHYRAWTSNLWPKASSIEAGLATYGQRQAL